MFLDVTWTRYPIGLTISTMARTLLSKGQLGESKLLVHHVNADYNILGSLSMGRPLPNGPSGGAKFCGSFWVNRYRPVNSSRK